MMICLPVLRDPASGNFFRSVMLCLGVLISLAEISPAVANTEAFMIEMKTEPLKIGDIKPAFIVYQDKPLPQVSINYVLKRYIKLFETAQSPIVKIDALNRINNLRAKYEVEAQKLAIDPVKQSKVVLESYQKILDSGEYYERMDELIYQTAKATSFTGDTAESIKRLKLLVGLYPRSPLVDESMFRMAEGYFELGDYDNAAAQYKRVLTFSSTDRYHLQTKYKLSWAEFRLDRLDEAGKQAISVMDSFPALENALNFSSLEPHQQELIQDNLRLLSIVFSKQEDARTLEALQEMVGHKKYAYLMYDALYQTYLAQDRFQDAAKVAQAYTKTYPLQFHAYHMAQNAVKSYRAGKFDIQEWQAKENLVAQFGLKSDYWQGLNEAQQTEVRPILVEYLLELGHMYYVKMQSAYEQQQLLGKASGNTATVQLKSPSYQAYARQSAEYYLQLVETRGDNRLNGGSLFLAAEALYKAGEYQRAITVYERAAYEQPGHADAINAGYAAILTYDNLASTYKPAMDAVTADMHKNARRDSVERFAKYFPGANQTPALLNALANDLFKEKDFLKAESVSREVLSKSSASQDVLYASWLVNAHSNFELAQYKQAETAYEKLIGFNRVKDLDVLKERLAAAIYKQAEKESVLAQSAELYLKVVDKVPNATIVPQALYDASSQLLQLNNWQQAIATLTVFQSRFPQHELYQDASDKLVFAYLENKEPISAAEKLVEIASVSKEQSKASNALYRAAELYMEHDFAMQALPLLERFINTYSHQYDLAIEAHNAHITYYAEHNQSGKKQNWQRKLVAFEKSPGAPRTARSMSLAANAAFELTYEDIANFEAVTLSLPLKKSLEQKTKVLKQVVGKLESLSAYKDAVIMSAATYQIGSIYRTLARDILKSERPAGLSELELEQYNILLEEQAYPFEEQAMDIYRINIEKVAQGHYDKWIEQTYAVLAEMNPTEYKRDLKVTPYVETMF
jgi:TolA-binding protein